MPQRLLFDSDVLIDYLRGLPEAIRYLEECSPEAFYLSAIGVAELFSGVRDGKERKTLTQFLTAFEVVPVSAEIAEQGGLFRRDYGKSHGTGLADALIAATAQVQRAQLVTLNARHFPMLADVLVPYQKHSF